MSNSQIGIYGLAVMGQNLVLNIADQGFAVTVYNRTESKTRQFMETINAEKPIDAAYTLEEFINRLAKPRRVLLMVKAGKAVEAVIEQLAPLLEADDIVLDGGNSHYKQTEQHAERLAAHGIAYLGLGISGGEAGARHGPSLMPGGPPEAYSAVQPILEAIAAEAQGEPCVAWLGPGSAGHYVKMVHNGIEYAMMQAIAEVYDLLKRGAQLPAEQIGSWFEQWNQGVLASFLVEITGHILQYREAGSSQPLIDLIADRAKQKGTGKWTSQDALDLGVPVPTLSAAVEARLLSAFKPERKRAATLLQGPAPVSHPPADLKRLAQNLEDALLATFVCAYAQGFSLLRFASAEYDYNLNLATVASIWRNGCIIRSDLLEAIRQTFASPHPPANLLTAPYFVRLLADRQVAWRAVVQQAVQMGVPTPALGSALAYYDGYRSARLPANLIQAQRDYFGAHTYERLNEIGQFHADWQAK
ncbi:MAG: NADP-dependent phosphogluconate dehydrogenase [Anaerolineae bacterium]|nr:NADP-dependent phosphogluconate dehydrogenase [Anaerolineae bacterium]